MMKWLIILTRSFLLSLAALLTSCDKDSYQGNSAPSPQLPTDVDLGHGYVRRGQAIHFLGGGTTGSGADATRIDRPSPQLLRLVVRSKFGSFKTAEGLDVATFEALSEEYTRDKNRVYFKVISPGVFLVIALKDADPETFEPLAFNLARDKNHVWLDDRIQRDVDPATLVMIDGGRVFKDKNRVYYQDVVIQGADPATFTRLSSAYYKDKNRIYWCMDPIQDADLATFEVLGDSFIAKDKNHVYRSGIKMTAYDPASVELILDDPAGYQVFSDRSGIHLVDMPFPRAKPTRTQVIDRLTVKADDQVLVVNSYHVVPVTLFYQENKVVAETFTYEPKTRKITGTITAELTPGGLKDFIFGPLPGHRQPPPVPSWQLDSFKSPHFVQQMNEAAKHLDGAGKP